MRKFTLFMLTLFMATVAMAQNKASLFKTAPGTPATTIDMTKWSPASNNVMAAPKKVEAITETPEGTLHENMYRFSSAYEAQSLGKGVYMLSDGIVGTLVEGTDGYIYMKDPFSRFAYGSWIKGKLEDDIVTFQFPQFIYSEVSSGFTLNCYTMRMRVNSAGTDFEKDPTSQEMKFRWKDGKLTQLDEDAVLGMVAVIPEMGDMEIYIGYADYDIRFMPVPGTKVTAPQNLETETYMLNYWPDDDKQDYRMVQVGTADGNIYVNNISNTNPQAWIQGAYDGTNARFFTGDYLGISYRMNAYDPDQHVFSLAGREVKTPLEGGSYSSSYYKTDHIDFAPDQETGILSSDSILAANAGVSRLYAETFFRRPSLEKFTETAGTPQDPIFGALSEYSSTSGFGIMVITMPKLTTDGKRMNLDKLSYKIYLDGEVMTFYPDEYWYIDKELQEMPYSHTDKRDFTIDADLHYIYFYQAGYSRIGVQMVYRGGGEEHKSHIIYYGEETPGDDPDPENPDNPDPEDPDPGIDDTGGEAVFGYDMGNTETDLWGTSKTETYDVAMHLDGNMFKGKTIRGFRVPLVDLEHIANVKVWLASELALETVDDKNVNKADIVVKEVTERDSWVEVRLDKPYAVTSRGVYAGLSLESTDINTNEGKRPIVVTPEMSEEGFYVHSSRTYRNWQSIASELGKSLALQVIIGGVQENAAALAEMPEVKGMVDETTPLTLNVKNHGSNPITSIDYSYSIGEQPAVALRKTFSTPIPAHYDAPVEFTITLPAMSESNVYELTVKIDKVNDVENTDPHAEVKANLVVYGLTPKHRAVVEEYTGTWCGNCPRGIVGMEEMARRYPDDFIGISIHNGDPMQITTTYPFPNTSFPNVHLDRTYFEIDPYLGVGYTGFGLEDVWKYQCEEVIAPAAISVTAEWTDNSMTTINATAAVSFPLATTSIPYRIAYMLLADSLSGTSSSWAQTNYYSGESSSNWDLEGMAEFCNGPHSIYIKYNDVMIAHSDYKGVANSLPATAEAGVPLKHTFQFNVSNIKGKDGDNLVQNKKNLRIVAMLIDQQTSAIVNANKCRVSTATGITQPTDNRQELVKGYYTLGGKRLLTPQRGLNIVKYADGTTAKIVVK